MPKNSIGIPHPRAPCLSKGPSVFPWASLSVLILESLEQEFCILPDPLLHFQPVSRFLSER